MRIIWGRQGSGDNECVEEFGSRTITEDYLRRAVDLLAILSIQWKREEEIFLVVETTGTIFLEEALAGNFLGSGRDSRETQV